MTADWGADQAARVQNLHKIMEMGAKTWHNAKERKEQKERTGDISKSERMLAEQSISELEVIDSALLSDELPVAAFTDKGFAAWLKSSAQQ